HWQDRHPYISASTSLIDDLASELSRTASRQWTLPTLGLMSQRLAEQPDFGWLQRPDAKALLDALATHTCIDVPKREETARLADLVARFKVQRALRSIAGRRQ